MKLNSDNTNLAENKVLILYILDKLNKDITNAGLFKITSSINNINYFYFQQTLTDLVDSKLVGTYTKDDETVFKITSEGKNNFALTKDVLPGIMKLKADNIFKKELYEIEEASSVSAEYTPKNEKDFTVKCKIVENNETIFEIKTFAGSADRAKRIIDNWNNNASSIYPKILNLLLNNESQSN